MTPTPETQGTTPGRREFAPNATNHAETRSTTDRIDRPSALTRDHSGRGAIRRITPMRRLSLFLRRPPAAPHPPCSHPFSPPSLSCLFLFLSRLFALSDCVPTFLRSLFVSLSLSLSLRFASTSAQSRVWVCAPCGRASLFLSHDSPPLISLLGPPRRALSRCDIANSCVSSRRADFCHAAAAGIRLRNLGPRGGGGGGGDCLSPYGAFADT